MCNSSDDFNKELVRSMSNTFLNLCIHKIALPVVLFWLRDIQIAGMAIDYEKIVTSHWKFDASGGTTDIAYLTYDKWLSSTR